MEGNVYGAFGEKGGTMEAKLYAFYSERGLPGSVNFYNKTATERLWNDNSFFQARYKNRLSELLMVQATAKYNYAFSRYKDVNDKYAAGFQEDRNTQHKYYGSAGVLLASPSPPNISTSLNDREGDVVTQNHIHGGDGLSASLTTDYAFTQLHNNFLRAAQPRRNTSFTVFAMQYKLKALTVTGSLLGAFISDEVQNGERPDDRKHLSPAIAFSWRPFDHAALRVRASYKDVFRVPTFADLYYLRVGNTGLKPEKARQWNVGLTWSGTVGTVIRYLSLTADGYYNKVEDKIVALPTLYIWRMMNFGEVEIKGSDANITMEIPLSSAVNLLLSGNYTFQHAIDITNPEAKNYKDQIPYTPRHTGTGTATFETPWVTVSYLLTAAGERYALPQNTKTNRINPYTEQSISLNRTFRWRDISWRLQGEVINLADTQYDVIQYYPMPGRSWRISVTIDL
jgi:outer membrane receptor protein involved in Fe transport